LVIGYWLLVIRYWLFVIGDSPLGLGGTLTLKLNKMIRFFLLSIALFCAMLNGQTVEVFNNNKSHSFYSDVDLGDIQMFRETRFVVYIKNTGAYPLKIERINMGNRYHEESDYYFSIDFEERTIQRGAVDSVVFRCTPVNRAGSHSFRYDIHLESTTLTPKQNSRHSFELRFNNVPPLSPKALIAFPNPQKRYTIGQVYRVGDAPPIPLVYANKGSAPLVVTVFNKKKDVKRTEMWGKVIPSGSLGVFQYQPDFTKLGHFDDTLHVLTNGLDSLHEVIVSGELLDMADGRPILHIEATDGIIDFGTRQENSDGLLNIKVKNIGTMPLVIRRMGTGGVAAPSWCREAIMPNDSCFVTYRYPTGRVGVFKKALTFETNEPQGQGRVWYVKGEVLAATKR
jgi:Protein of unknown function (DUF1573)